MRLCFTLVLSLMISQVALAASNLPDTLTCHFILRKYTTSDDAALTLHLKQNSIEYFRYNRDRSFFLHNTSYIRKFNPSVSVITHQLSPLLMGLNNSGISYNTYYIQDGRANDIEIIQIQTNPEIYILSSNQPYSVRHARIAQCRAGNL